MYSAACSGRDSSLADSCVTGGNRMDEGDWRQGGWQCVGCRSKAGGLTCSSTSLKRFCEPPSVFVRVSSLDVMASRLSWRN